MTIEEKVYQLLSGASAITDLVGNRIKPEGVYQGLACPYIRHFAASVEPIQTHDGGMAALKNWPYQISIFASSAASLSAVTVAVIETLETSVDPKFFLRGMPVLDGLESTDTPVLGRALLLDAWYE